ncbi:hypothetical protein M378DRAFT_181721 [Amanita muscaria Koide BX008]|uniref:Uncharacterized protein n=1 Tax=Amanita muscaria (strain Koide BX008) TaxID=946122 RepID=A0A0C2W7L3_AMAMK|nr:hypothetical protein M378DRAFT_181721 [Amanita muscaria Koide BX008]
MPPRKRKPPTSEGHISKWNHGVNAFARNRDLGEQDHGIRLRLLISNDHNTRSLSDPHFNGPDNSGQRIMRSMVGKCSVAASDDVEDQSPFEDDLGDNSDSDAPRPTADGGSGKGGTRLSKRKIPDRWSE